MPTYLNALSQTAMIDLLYAKAEIEREPDYPAVIRALDHVEQAAQTLGLLAEELKSEENRE